ncbi:MAG TPA: serine hydrolase domain-containing protein [Candidatus Limnocylindrales bacterium]|nr:serine hydrolase domain-containing protein [Candidatus Limnocylindrales bacterium]
MDPIIGPLTDRLDALSARFFAESRLPGLAVGVVRDGRLAWTASLGFADRATARPITPDTLFRIASITKSFTATAILQLRDEGRLRLDDPLAAHVPEARSITNPFGPVEDVTIRRLLTHTAGMPLGDFPGFDPWEIRYLREDQLLALLGDLRVVARPDTAWRYSNLGYALLGAVVHRVSGKPFTRYVERSIIKPADLGSTTFVPAGKLAKRAATGYGPTRYDDDAAVSPPFDPRTLEPDAGLWSTVEDLARWIGVHGKTADDDRRGDGHRVLDGPTLREMQRPAVIADAGWSYAQGFGWGSIRLGDSVWVGHTGSLNGFRAIVRFRPADGLGVIALVNGSTRPNALAHEIAAIVLEAHRAAAVPTVPDARAAPTPEAWRELLGTYREDDYGFGVRVEARDGKLVLIDEENPSERPALVPTDDPLVFRIGEGEMAGEPVIFLRNAAGEIAALNDAGGPLRRLAYVPR